MVVWYEAVAQINAGSGFSASLALRPKSTERRALGSESRAKRVERRTWSAARDTWTLAFELNRDNRALGYRLTLPETARSETDAAEIGSGRAEPPDASGNGAL